MTKFLQLDEHKFSESYNQLALGFQHRLNETTYFSLEHLASLAEYLYDCGGNGDVYNAKAGTSIGSTFEPNNVRGVAAGDAIRDIKASGSWMVLKRIEQHKEYKELVDNCLDEIGAAAPELARNNLAKAEGFIFVTSAGGLTPYHIDPQWSFLAQIHGTKQYSIYDEHNPQEIEQYLSGSTMAAVYDESKESKVCRFELKPGMAASQPVFAPHAASVGADDYSISLSIALITKQWQNQASTRRANHILRRWGVEPRTVGESPAMDRCKNLAYRLGNRALREVDRLTTKRH